MITHWLAALVGAISLLAAPAAFAQDGREVVYQGVFNNTTAGLQASSTMRLVFQGDRVNGSFTLRGLFGAGALAGERRGQACYLLSTSGIRFEGRCDETSFAGAYWAGDERGEFSLQASGPAAAPGSHDGAASAWIMGPLSVNVAGYPAGAGPRWAAPLLGWRDVEFQMQNNVTQYSLTDSEVVAFGIFPVGDQITQPGPNLAVGFNLVIGSMCAARLTPRARGASGDIVLGAETVWFDTSGDLINAQTGQRCSGASDYVNRIRGAVGFAAQANGDLSIDAEFRVFSRAGGLSYIYRLQGYRVANIYTAADARADLQREAEWRAGLVDRPSGNQVVAALFLALAAAYQECRVNGCGAPRSEGMSDQDMYRYSRQYYSQRDADFQDWVNSRPDIYR